MLFELAATNFAIIEQLHLTFGPGFNVLTGETGAGKSILIDAVNVLLGGRCGPEFVRSGAEQARVEGIFTLPVEGNAGDDGELPLTALLDEYGIVGDEGTVILSREIQRSGRTVARINGRAVPLSTLQQVGRALVDIHGQGEHLSLLRVSQHAGFLDRYAGLLERRRALAAGVAELRQVQTEIERLLRDEREQARRVDLLSFQVQEIRNAGLHPHEEEALVAERLLLSNAERLSTGADAAYRLLYGGSHDERAALDALGEAVAHVSQLAKLDPSLAQHLRTLEEASDQLQDVADSLRRYRDGVEFNPARLEAIEERLDLIQRLKRKYGSSIAEVLHFGEAAAAELDNIAHGEERLAMLRQREAALRTDLGRQAEALSAARQEAAERLAAAVEQELGDLNMAKTRFKVGFERRETPDGLPLGDGHSYAFDSTGVDRVEFLIAPNPGEPLRPFAKIASGGETARLMLALKTILTRADAVPTLIFDEIDVGIGGRSGQIVGCKLWNLTAGHQVLCVTHLPQIACYGDVHFQISKAVVAERTVTTVQTLAEEERVAEVAAMLGGATESLAAQENARELLARAGRLKQDARSASAAMC